MALFTDIVFINLTQYREDRDFNLRSGVVTFILEHIQGVVYNVTRVLPFNKYRNRSSRCLSTSISHPEHPEVRYVTDLTLINSHNKKVPLKALHMMTILALNCYEGNYEALGDNYVHIDVFSNNYYFYNFDRSQDSWYNKSIKNPHADRRKKYFPFTNHTHYGMDLSVSNASLHFDENFE